MTTATGTLRTIRGRALILWDPKQPGKKRDAVDTDQITPADDCVSESLATLDERWKSGAFRHVMPDFRARVHAGETFLVAGDRFAIGSSREMSPAGLKGIAEEAGLEMVVICGKNMGDIFRRNALNLGLHVVQSVEAVADAKDGDTFEFDVEARALRNATQGKAYTPVPLTLKEEEIRQGGGIFEVGRREVTAARARRAEVEFPDPDLARRMTSTEQIIWAHRVDKRAEVKPGGTLQVYADLLPASDGTAPFAIHTFRQILGPKEADRAIPLKAAIANDHFVFTGRSADDKQTAISAEFAERHGIGPPYYAAPGSGIFHFYFPEQGLIVPGGFYPGADSHSRAYGAYGAVGIGVGSTTLGFGWATGYIYFTLAKQRRVTFTGKLQPWVGGKDIVLRLLARWGSRQSEGMSVDFIDRDRQLPIPFRNTIANMMAEGEALNGIFAQDEITDGWFRERGIARPYLRVTPGADAVYEKDEALDLTEVAPMIAKPFSPGNAFPAEEVARERITFNKAMIGSCTNGGYGDLLAAALVIRAARAKGATHAAKGTEFIIFPGSGTVKKQI
jgi:3-isopropylmalate/(R)-2-methylmalate dehydratase large subunit